MRGFNYKKAVQALNYLARKQDGSINKMKAIKLVWLADRLHLRNYGRTITNDIYFALKNGTVPSTTLNLIECNDTFLDEQEAAYSKKYITKNNPHCYSSIEEPYLKVFSKTDIETIDLIYLTYGHLDPFELSEHSHLFPEWKKFEAALKSGASRFPIDIEDFFLNVEDGTGLFVDIDTNLEIVKDMYNESQQFHSAFK